MSSSIIYLIIALVALGMFVKWIEQSAKVAEYGAIAAALIHCLFGSICLSYIIVVSITEILK